jgi:hypothetical protein
MSTLDSTAKAVYRALMEAGGYEEVIEQMTWQSLCSMTRGKCASPVEALVAVRALRDTGFITAESGVAGVFNARALVPLDGSGIPIGTKRRCWVSKIFIVHGHDEALKQTVARYLEKLKLEAIILHEQVAGGSSGIIEKLERHADAEFAVVLLTPDDIGGKAGSSASDLRGRARQNVIFELGMFVGRLGRGRVHCLKQGDIEIPTDYGGIEYTPTDDPSVSWKLRLAQELRAAGVDIDFDDIS